MSRCHSVFIIEVSHQLSHFGSGLREANHVPKELIMEMKVDC